jgi:hypothetical protein
MDWVQAKNLMDCEFEKQKKYSFCEINKNDWPANYLR